MKVAKPGGTREQDAVATWLQHAETMRPRFAELAVPTPSLVVGFDAMVNAVAQLGECELNARALDRVAVLNVFTERRKALEQRVNKLNDAGIQSLKDAESACLAISREVAKLKFDNKRLGELVTAFETNIREQLADWEMKGSDAERLMAGFSELAKVAREGGPKAIGDWVARRFKELAKGRQEPGRGTQENMPWWKWMFIVGFVGWMLAGAIVYAAFSGNWSGAVRFGYSLGWSAILVTHLIAYALFC